MLEAITYNGMMEDIENTQGYNIIGILIAHPGSEFTQKTLKFISSFHHRSGEYTNMYCVGYGAYWNSTTYPDMENICEIDNAKWSFSSKMFSDFIFDLEEKSKWEYSGETELILLNYKDGILDFSNCLIFRLDKMIRDNSISSPEWLFERIFRHSRKSNSLDNFSDKQVINIIRNDFIEVLKEKLFGDFYDTFNKSKYFCVKNLEK